MYKYPEFLKKEEGKDNTKVQTAVLSTTAKVKARQDRKTKAEGGDVVMEEVKKKEEEEKGTEEEKKEEAPKVPEKEPDYQILQNPSRVLPAQVKKIRYQRGTRYEPVVLSRCSGFILVRDNREGKAEQFYDDEEVDPNAPNPWQQADLEIPADFEFDPRQQNAS